MSNDWIAIRDLDGVPMAAFRKSQVDTVQYGVRVGGGAGCYLGVNGSTCFIPNMTVEQVLTDILGVPKTLSAPSEENTVAK